MCAAASINVAHYKCTYYYYYFLNPLKTRVGKIEKVKKKERLMFRAVVQLKTIVQQNRIETK